MTYSGQGTADEQDLEWNGTTHLWAPKGLVQTQFAEVVVDTTTSSTAFVTLLTIPITTTGNSRLLISATFSCSVATLLATGLFRIRLDAVAQRGSAEQLTTLLQQHSGVLTWRSGVLAAAAHTVDLQWRVSSGASVLQIRPVAVPDAEHGSLAVMEVNV